jgi:hypothetical protein
MCCSFSIQQHLHKIANVEAAAAGPTVVHMLSYSASVTLVPNIGYKYATAWHGWGRRSMIPLKSITLNYERSWADWLVEAVQGGRTVGCHRCEVTGR